MDLDVVIINNIDHLWDFEGDAFVINDSIDSNLHLLSFFHGSSDK